MRTRTADEIYNHIKSKIIWRPLQRGFDVGRFGYNIDWIINHTVAGYEANVYDWFNRVGTQSSATFLVRMDGMIEQYTDINNTTWHAGSAEANMRSIGIEHSDQNNPYDSVRTPELYESSAWLNAWIIKMRGWYIPPNLNDFINAQFFRLHKNMPNVSTDCPAGLDVVRIYRRAYEILTENLDKATIFDSFQKEEHSYNVTSANLYNIQTGQVEIRYKQLNEPIKTSYAFDDWRMTEYSYKNRIPKAFKHSELIESISKGLTESQTKEETTEEATPIQQQPQQEEQSSQQEEQTRPKEEKKQIKTFNIFIEVYKLLKSLLARKK